MSHCLQLVELCTRGASCSVKQTSGLVCSYTWLASPSSRCACRQPLQASARLQGGAGIQGMGVSMVDALSTLKIMGLEEEFQQ